MHPDPLGPLLANDGVVVLDGGLATQLEAQGHDLSDRLWSATLLETAPEAIIEAHLAYFRAGARVATTASYQATFEGFAGRGIDHDQAVQLMRRSVALAAEARDRYLAELTARVRAGSRDRCWSPPRSDRTGRCSRTDPSTAAATGAPSTS